MVKLFTDSWIVLARGSLTSAVSGVTLDPPVNTVAPVISGTAQEGETLSIADGTWTGLEPMIFTYQLARFDASSVFVEDIAGATNNTYATTVGDIGYKIGCYVTGTNDDGSSEVLSNLTAVVAAAPIEFPSTLDGTLIARYKADEETGLTTGGNLTVATDLSANGNDLATIGGSPTWESPVVNGHAVYRGDGASDYIKGTFGANVTGGNYLIGIVRKWNSAFAAQQVLLDSSTSLGAAYYRKDTNVGNSFYNGQLIGAAASGATDVWAYVECRVNGASSTIKVNGTTVASGTLGATAVTGLTLFSAGDTAQKSDADIAEAFLINTPSVADATACKEYAMAEYGFAPPPGATANIVCEGDSHTAGTLTQPESYPAQLQGLLNSSYPNAYVVNNGTGGHTWLDLIAGEAGLTALVQVGIPNILVVECGLNDYAAGASLATIVGRMETFCADVDGIYDEIIVSTVMPAELAGADLTGTDFEDLADLYMAASVSANVTLIDQRTAAPTIGADGAQLTSTFQADHKHLSASGNVIKAETAETALLALLP